MPLRASSAVIGTLEVAGRLGDNLNFGPGDVRLLEAVAELAVDIVRAEHTLRELCPGVCVLVGQSGPADHGDAFGVNFGRPPQE